MNKKRLSLNIIVIPPSLSGSSTSRTGWPSRPSYFAIVGRARRKLPLYPYPSVTEPVAPALWLSASAYSCFCHETQMSASSLCVPRPSVSGSKGMRSPKSKRAALTPSTLRGTTGSKFLETWTQMRRSFMGFTSFGLRVQNMAALRYESTSRPRARLPERSLTP